MQFQYVMVHVDDLEPLTEWYVEHFGLELETHSPQFVRLADEQGAPIAFHAGGGLGTPEGVHLHFEVDDVDAEYRRLTDRGVAFLDPPESTEWGHRTADMHDPAGHRVTILEELE